MNVSEVLDRNKVALELVAKDKDEVIAKMTDLLCKSGALTDKQAFMSDVLERERVCSTGIGGGIAIPHGKSANVTQTAAAVAKLAVPVRWENTEDGNVNFVVLLAVNENDKGNTHVKLLSQIARKLASEETAKRLAEAADADEIIKIFSE